MTHAMGDDMSEEETKQRLLGGWWQSGLVDNILTSLQLCMNSTQDNDRGMDTESELRIG
jgi:hypothetical protein